MHKRTIESAKELCRELRKNQTRSEELLWEKVRNRRFLDTKFLRQFPIFFTDISGKESFYIADFYCHKHRLVIELDGENHYFQQQYDQERTGVLKGMGITVQRFRNEEIESDLEAVLKKLEELLTH